MSGDHTKYHGTAELQKQIIEVTELQENEDGSATIQIETSRDVTAVLVGIGLQTLVKQAMQEVINEEGEDAE
mgnify:CR=1 FL=1